MIGLVRLLRWLGFQPGRVLQLEEVRALALDAMRAAALPGLAVRYLPVFVRIGVSAKDFSFLQPFRANLAALVSQDVAALAAEPGWGRTTDAFEMQLVVEPSLRLGDAPAITTAFEAGTRHARFVPPPIEAPSGGARPDSATALELVITASRPDGTALQERRLVLLGEPARAADVLPAAASNGLVDFAQFLPARAEQPPTPVDLREVHPAPEYSEAATARLPAAASVQWATLRHGASGPEITWCPGGVVVIGRQRPHCHVAPDVPVPTLSRSHLAIERQPSGEMAIMDLGSSNGTRVSGERMGQKQVLTLPATISIGSESLVMILVHAADIAGS